jgi:hypothetical protein
MPEAVTVVVPVHTVAQAAVADAEKVEVGIVVGVAVDTVAEAANAKVEAAVVVSVIFLAIAVKIAAEVIPVEHVVKAATDADASSRIKSNDKGAKTGDNLDLLFFLNQEPRVKTKVEPGAKNQGSRHKLLTSKYCLIKQLLLR